MKAPSSRPATPRRPKPTIGRYQLISKLGQGGQGTVYLAEDPVLHRKVAVKVLTLAAEMDAQVASRALQEGRNAGRLNRPGIVAVHDAGEVRGVPYLVFEYVEGETLKRLVEREGKMPLARACALMRPVLEAMSHAHDAGIVHLDINPSNIIVPRNGPPQVMDFGLSRLREHGEDPNEFAAGTLRYMAPEHVLGRPLGAHTDVFALCLVLFELLTGHPARNEKSAARVLATIAGRDVELIELVRDDALQSAARVLRAGFEPEAGNRLPDATALLESFDLLLGHTVTPGSGEGQRTIEFLLRRMQRRSDFPALSRSLSEINRMTAGDSSTSADQLAAVVARDYALTRKLLAMANSAFYGGAREVTSVAETVRLIGFEGVRLAANGLAIFGHVQSGTDSAELLDSLLRAFTAGLVARHLARHLARGQCAPLVEEAFVCGMFQTLGETMTRFYFPEEHADIQELVRGGQTSRFVASRSVLGISYRELGVTVAEHWQFPGIIQNAIAGMPESAIRRPESAEEALRDVCVFASDLCDIPASSDPQLEIAAISALLDRFRPSFSLSGPLALQTLGAAIDKLEQIAPSLGVSLADSSLSSGTRTLIEHAQASDDNLVHEQTTTV